MAAIQAANAAQDHVVGMLLDLRMYNDWGRGKLVMDDGRRITVKGNALAGLNIGSRYRMSGSMENHEKYGAQLDVTQVQPDMESVDALVNHMVSNYRNVGMATARKVAEFHQAEGSLALLKDILIHRPSTLDFTPFTDRPVSLRDDEESVSRRVRDSLSIRFGGLGIARGVLKDLGSWLLRKASEKRSPNSTHDIVSMANDVLDDNPYAAIGNVERLGFGTADLMGRKIGIAMDDPKRIGAIVCYAVQEGCADGGHMYLTEGQLFTAIRRIDPGLNPIDAIRMAIEMGAPLVLDTSGDQVRYYSKSLREAETTLVHHIATRLTTPVQPLTKLKGDALVAAIHQAVRTVGAYNEKPNFELDETQFAALSGILTSTCSIHTLTGGPGCGKTAIVEVLMEFLAQNNRKRTTFCAPIGKAAKVLTSRISRWGHAKTIHSTLEFKGKFERNNLNPLETDFVVADEQSMLDGIVGAAFYDAIPIKAHILHLGDPDQLAAVASGRVLKSVLELPGIDHHLLSTTHRNAGALLALIKMANKGIWPGPAKRAEMAAEEGRLEFAGLPAPTPGVFAELATQVMAAAQQYGGLEKVGVICPKRKGDTSTPDWNVTHLNHALRDYLNPDPNNEKKVAGTVFRLNDRIIVGSNMMLLQTDGAASAPSTQNRSSSRGSEPVFDADGVMLDDGDFSFGGEFDAESEGLEGETYVCNGDTGWLESVQYGYEDGVRKVQSLKLRLDDDRTVIFPAGELDNLNLAYAITVHAAQGSEYAKVFAIVTPGHEQFMHRALVMTEFSRGKVELKIMGDNEEIAKIVARPAPHRNCALTERVAMELADNDSLIEPLEEDQRSTPRPRAAAA